MNYLNESELFSLMNRLGCFNVEPLSKENCSELMTLINGFRNFTNPFNAIGGRLVLENRILDVVGLLFFSLAILLNCTLQLLLYKDPLKRFRNASSFLIFNLAIADLSSACFSLVVEKFSSEISTKLSFEIFPWLLAATYQCSVITLMFISLDRYLAVAYPLRYRVMVRPTRTIAIIIVIWLVSLSVTCLLFFTPQVKARINGTEIYAANLFIIIAVILTFYPLTYVSFRRQRRQLVSLNSTNQQLRQEKLKTEKNIANTMLLVSLCLILFTSPYLVMFMFHVRNCLSCILNKHFQKMWIYFRLFTMLRFSINPVIYAWRLPNYRKSFQRLITSTYNAVLSSRSQNPSGSTAVHD